MTEPHTTEKGWCCLGRWIYLHLTQSQAQENCDHNYGIWGKKKIKKEKYKERNHLLIDSSELSIPAWEGFK